MNFGERADQLAVDTEGGDGLLAGVLGRVAFGDVDFEEIVEVSAQLIEQVAALRVGNVELALELFEKWCEGHAATSGTTSVRLPNSRREVVMLVIWLKFQLA